MSIEVQLGTPLAEAIQNAVQPKLVENGWSSGPDDAALAEYVILMLVNRKDEEAIAAELSTDLLNLGPEDPGAAQFAKWLFEQIEALNAQLSGQAPASAPAVEAQVAQEQENFAAGQSQLATDSEMGESASDIPPTEPKSMRNGTQRLRDKRMLGQINKNLTAGSDAALHRVRAANGAGRINSHSSREPPTGPRAQQLNRAMQMANGRPMAPGMGMPQGQMGFPQQQQMMGGINPAGQFPPMNIMQMMEQQAQMMAQIQAQMLAQQSGGPGPAFNPAFQNGMNGQGQVGKSMFDRVENRGQRRSDGSHHNRQHQETSQNNANADPSSSMEVESSSQQPADPANTLCKFNLSCTRSDCNFAHQSAAAPPGITVDMTDSCTYGAACKNFKCTAKHPSPANKFGHQAEIMCHFFPYCKNRNCPFKHPAPMCRNGADCSVPGCKFTHSTTMCKFNPCKNPNCIYKHVEGQKGVFSDKVWTADGGVGEQKAHVSERKFVTEEGGDEELILPGSGSNEQSSEKQESQETQETSVTA